MAGLALAAALLLAATFYAPLWATDLMEAAGDGGEAASTYALPLAGAVTFFLAVLAVQLKIALEEDLHAAATRMVAKLAALVAASLAVTSGGGGSGGGNVQL
ncbi:hypothetical protein ACP70R_008387 [Stipagrostis hirtigluma subsp. patula]